MEANLIDLNHYAVKATLKTLLQDKTTKKNIIWATNSYEDYGSEYKDSKQITIGTLIGLKPMTLQPRVLKKLDEQQDRTHKRAEVMTPSWLCNAMNNVCDKEWFGDKCVFNVETQSGWITNERPIPFKDDKSWHKYIDLRRLEVTCGEAPYIVSRYDTTTGKVIEPPTHRIGFLDRKIRVVNENTLTEEEWFYWVIRAYQSSYGFEFQGDNLLIARINLLMTFVDNMQFKWHRDPSKSELNKIANIIAWNIFQMDGLTDTVPLGIPQPAFEEVSLFELYEPDSKLDEKQIAPKCLIYDWRQMKSQTFESLKKERN